MQESWNKPNWMLMGTMLTVLPFAQTDKRKLNTSPEIGQNSCKWCLPQYLLRCSWDPLLKVCPTLIVSISLHKVKVNKQSDWYMHAYKKRVNMWFKTSNWSIHDCIKSSGLPCFCITKDFELLSSQLSESEAASWSIAIRYSGQEVLAGTANR
jgi:hypothetical protein